MIREPEWKIPFIKSFCTVEPPPTTGGGSSRQASKANWLPTPFSKKNNISFVLGLAGEEGGRGKGGRALLACISLSSFSLGTISKGPVWKRKYRRVAQIILRRTNRVRVFEANYIDNAVISRIAVRCSICRWYLALNSFVVKIILYINKK